MELNNKENFNSIINEDKITVIDFYATWCGPCKMLSPVIQNVEEKMGSSINFIKIDIDKFNEIASEFRIQSVPTIVFFKNGNEIDRSIGYIDEHTLIEKINSYK